MSLHRTIARLVFYGALALVTAAPAAAQQTESRIVGRITDASGAVLPGATLTITSRQTGAVRTAVADAEGRYVVTNLAPGTYDVKGELDGFAPKSGELSVGAGDIKPLDLALAVANVAEAVTVLADATVIDTTSAKIGVNVSPEELQEPAGQRPQLRQPHDARDRRHDRRQRRLGERPVQRQVEPAELPELRRRRRQLRLGREPGLPQRHRLAVPAADVDGVDRGVPRQLGPGAGRERPRRRRQHHRHQQERQQPLQRLVVQLLPQRRARLGQQVRRQEAGARVQPVRRVAGRPDRQQPDVLLRQLRGPEADDRPVASPRRCRATRPFAASRRASRSAAAQGQSPARTQAVAPLLAGFPQGTVADRQPAARARDARHAGRADGARLLGARRSPLHQQSVALRARALQRRRRRHARSHGNAAARARHAAAAERRPQPPVALRHAA